MDALDAPEAEKPKHMNELPVSADKESSSPEESDASDELSDDELKGEILTTVGILYFF